MRGYNEKINDENFGNEKAYLTQIGINLRKSKKTSGLINATFNVVNINYNGNSNSTIGYEMLEGLHLALTLLGNLIYNGKWPTIFNSH